MRTHPTPDSVATATASAMAVPAEPLNEQSRRG